MSKSADYCITAVKHGVLPTAIVQVEARRDLGTSLGAAQRFTKDSVVNAILLQGLTFITAPRNGGKYVRGADVRVVRVNGSRYLRTDRNSVQADNLGSLPEIT